jgi:hypoxanthine-DNA glycosylase
MTIQSFEAIAGDDATVLILGTMPGVASLRANQYYAHPDNLFWDIIFRVLDKNWNYEEIVAVDYDTKRNLLLNSGVAVWDVLQFCDRKGSLDTAIQKEIKNDLVDFISKHPKLKVIFFNGQKAQKYFIELMHEISDVGDIEQVVLQSTSPSNTKNSFYILKEWTVIQKFLCNEIAPRY